MALNLAITSQDWLFIAGVALGVILTTALEMVLAARGLRRIDRPAR